MPSRPSHCLPEFGEQRVDLGVAGDVAGKHQLAAELGSQFDHAVLDALALVAEGKLRAFAAAWPWRCRRQWSGC